MINIDIRDKRAIYEQIVDKLTNLMLNGVLQVDEKLPSVRALAGELSINPNTIQRAYIELERLGYIYTVAGKGSFVSDIKKIKKDKKEEILLEIEDKIKSAKDMGISKETISDKLDKIYEK